MQPRKNARTRSANARFFAALSIAALLAASCGSSSSSSGSTNGSGDSSAGSPASGTIETVAVETVAVDSGAENDTGSDSGPLETVALDASETGVTASTAKSNSTKPSALKHLPGAVAVTFDASRDTARPLKETVVPLTETTDVLAMKISGFSYRGVICGFTMQGEAPPSPVTIRQFVQTPNGTFDSGPIDVSWTKLDDATVKAGDGQVETWNFSAAANTNRQGPGWVVSLGGVTADIGDATATTPTDGGCELRSKDKVFGPKTGPVGYWAGFAVA